MRWTLATLLLMGLLPFTSSAQTPCSDGVDCFCDRVSVPSSNLLLCEDWEDARWHSVEDVDGAWIDADGTDYRGIGSLWTQLYGPANQSCAWLDGEPENPTLGVSCSLAGGGLSCFAAPLMPGDEFQAPLRPQAGSLPTPPPGSGPANYACLKPVSQPAHLDSENLGLTGPAALFDNKALAFRVPQGNGASEWPANPNGPFDRATAGITGARQWTPVTEIGVTLAVAYSSNVATAGIWDGPWKHDEYGSNGTAQEFWFSGNTGTGGAEQLPFSPFRFANGRAACEAALSAATVIEGNFDCSDVSLRYSPDPEDYQQSVDWPWGTWGCVRAYQSGMGTPNMELWIRFQGPDDTAERTLIHITGFDGRALSNAAYDGFIWNHYANINQATGSHTSAPVYRFQDSVAIVGNQEPVTCADLGFDGTPPMGPDGGSPTDGGPSADAGHSSDGGSSSAPDAGDPVPGAPGGCGCDGAAGTAAPLCLLAIALVAHRRDRPVTRRRSHAG